jgi:hypothetical protein
MGLFGMFSREKREEKQEAKHKQQLAEHHTAALNSLDATFTQAEQITRIIDTNPKALQLDSSLLEDLVNGLWDSVYKGALATFISAFDVAHQNGNIDDHDYGQIQPVFSKWKALIDSQSLDQECYRNFCEDLKAFSKQYPLWFDGGRTLYDEFNTKVWEPWLKQYSLRAESISQSYQRFLERKKGRASGLISSNYAFMSPYEFEELLADLFKKMGYEVEVTPKSGDYGIDVVARNQNDVIAIQAKKYSTANKVSNRDVQRLLGAMQLQTVRANKGILITTSDFTAQAVEQSKGTPVELWNGEHLNSLLVKYLRNQ